MSFVGLSEFERTRVPRRSVSAARYVRSRIDAAKSGVLFVENGLVVGKQNYNVSIEARPVVEIFHGRTVVSPIIYGPRLPIFSWTDGDFSRLVDRQASCSIRSDLSVAEMEWLLMLKRAGDRQQTREHPVLDSLYLLARNGIRKQIGYPGVAVLRGDIVVRMPSQNTIDLMILDLKVR